ncbi:MAG TPA: FAD-dependent oxidoreductase, partial [Negativicutes bacterium]
MLKDWYKMKKPQKLFPHAVANPSNSTTPITKKYDAIVVGAGPAGATAAYFMAKEGLDVLLLDRAPYPGAKNCGGAALIAEHIHKLFPNFWEECPCERIVTDQSYWFMTEDSLLAAKFSSLKLAAAPYNRLTVKRINLYKWLTEKAVATGATLLLGHQVSEVIFDEQQAKGVRVGPPHNIDFSADIIILADGVNSLLAEKADIAPRICPQNTSLYVKETIELSSAVIEERFNLLPGCGSIISLIGYPTAGFNGTGSIHTFKDCINLNVGMSVADFAQSGLPPSDLLERIKKHPLIQPLLDGGVTREYGASLIPEGGYYAIPELVHDRLLIVGDAGLLVNGTHGINLAMWSGFFAAKTAFAAKISRNFSRGKLFLYRTLLNESFVMQDMKANAGAAKLQRDIPYMFDLYTRIANEA